MAIFNYQNYLNIDDDTYNSWLGFIEELEANALTTARRLMPGLLEDGGNAELFNYAKEVVYLGVYGDTLSTSLLEFHKSRLAESEEYFRWFA